MINILFYAFLMVFIWNDFYYINNSDRLNRNFKNKDIWSITKWDFTYYLTKVMYWIWMPIGLFSNFYLYFILLLGFNLLRFPIYHFSKRFFPLYDKIVPLISVVILFVILGLRFIC